MPTAGHILAQFAHAVCTNTCQQEPCPQKQPSRPSQAKEACPWACRLRSCELHRKACKIGYMHNTKGDHTLQLHSAACLMWTQSYGRQKRAVSLPESCVVVGDDGSAHAFQDNQVRPYCGISKSVWHSPQVQAGAALPIANNEELGCPARRLLV